MTVEAPERITDEAPYGINPRTGEPYKVPPEQREALSANLAKGRAAKAAASGAAGRATAAPKTAASKRSPAIDPRAKTVQGIFQAAALLLTGLGRINPVFIADAAAVAMNSAPIADAVAETARDSERMAAVLDRIGAAGPFTVLVAAAAPLVLQIAANHRLMPAQPEFGIVEPDVLIAQVMEDAANAQGGGAG